MTANIFGNKSGIGFENIPSTIRIECFVVVHKQFFLPSSDAISITHQCWIVKRENSGDTLFSSTRPDYNCGYQCLTCVPMQVPKGFPYPCSAVLSFLHCFRPSEQLQYSMLPFLCQLLYLHVRHVSKKDAHAPYILLDNFLSNFNKHWPFMGSLIIFCFFFRIKG